jgi:hypothetical protein
MCTKDTACGGCYFDVDSCQKHAGMTVESEMASHICRLAKVQQYFEYYFYEQGVFVWKVLT